MSVFESFRNQFTDFIDKCQQMEEKIKRLEDENRKLKSENEKLKSLKDKEEVQKVLEVEDEKCPVCIDIIDQKFRLPCNHEFCTSCIYEWAENDRKTRVQPRCPMCRTGFPMSVFNGVNTPRGHSNRCECGKLNPNSTHHYTNSHNTYLFVHAYRRNLDHFLDEEFDRLFGSLVTGYMTEATDFFNRTSSGNPVPPSAIFGRASERLSYSVMKRVGSASQRLRQQAVVWVKNYLQGRFTQRPLGNFEEVV